MKVILTEEVKKLGKKGDIIEVSEGYARNFLLPKKVAVEATNGKISELKHIQEREARQKANELEAAKELGKKISSIQLTIKTKAGENGKLFGAVTSKEIAEQIQKEQGLTIDKRKIELKEPIKAVGSYNVTVKIHPEVHAQLNLNVTT